MTTSSSWFRGGVDGIEFYVRHGTVIVVIDNVPRQVSLLAWHTHPRPTGPSDHDRALRLLGQADSLIYEMFGDGRGIRYRAANPEGKA